MQWDRTRDDHTHWLAPVSAIAAVALGEALQIANGVLDSRAIGYVGGALVLLLLAVIVRRPARLAAIDARLVPTLCGAGLVLQIAQLNSSLPGHDVRIDPSFTAAFNWGLAGLALTAAALVSGVRRVPIALLLTMMVVAHFAMGAEVISHAPGNFIDVAVFQRQSADALRHGINPYAITFPNIYGYDLFYGPGASVDGQLQFGYPYFPLSLLAAMPGELLAGDHRYAALVAMELAAILMVYARRDGFGAAAAALYLTTPRVFFILEQSWTEPFVVLGLAAVVFVACRNSRALPWVFGAFIALKQYLVFALPAALLLVPTPIDRRAVTRLFLKAALAGAIVTIPFVLWDPMAFIHSVITLQFRQPFRFDSLSFLSWWALKGHPEPSAAIAFVVAGLLTAIAMRRLPHTAAGYSGALAITFLGFFAFNKQAFANYYFFVIGALCTTLAASVRVPRQAAPAAQRPTDVIPSDSNNKVRWVAAAALVAACLVPVVWPGDVPFINDEPLLIDAAVSANAAGHLAQRGLMGTFDFAYGPLPTWIYQALVAASTDLVAVATVHAVLVTAVTAFALWWLSRSLGLWAWFAPVPLLSPYLWFYARVLWDNPFLIPLGALAAAGYAAHLASGSRAGLRVAIGAMAAMPLVHLMSVAFVVPLAAHMVLVRWRSLWHERASITGIIATAGIAAWPYWHYLANAEAPGPGGAAGLRGWIFPLLGGRLLSARELAYFYGQSPIKGWAMELASAVSWIAYGLVWAGIAVAVWAVITAGRTHRWTARAHIAIILLGTLVCQMALDGFTGKFEHPQYYNGTWITFTVLAWMAVDWLATRRSIARWSAAAATGLLATALLVTVGTLAVRLHRSSGTREIYGPTLANQQEVARSLAQFSPASPVSTSVKPYLLYPHALTTLRRLNARRYAFGSYGDLEIRYASPDPSSGAIEVVTR